MSRVAGFRDAGAAARKRSGYPARFGPVRGESLAGC